MNVLTSAPVPTTFLPAGQATVTLFAALELSGLVAETRSIREGAVVHMAMAVTVQPAVVPVSSSSALTVTEVRSALGRTSSRTTWPAAPSIRPPAPVTLVPAGQGTVTLLFCDVSGLVLASCRTLSAAAGLANAIVPVASARGSPRAKRPRMPSDRTRGRERGSIVGHDLDSWAL